MATQNSFSVSVNSFSLPLTFSISSTQHHRKSPGPVSVLLYNPLSRFGSTEFEVGTRLRKLCGWTRGQAEVTSGADLSVVWSIFRFHHSEESVTGEWMTGKHLPRLMSTATSLSFLIKKKASVVFSGWTGLTPSSLRRQAVAGTKIPVRGLWGKRETILNSTLPPPELFLH